MSPALNPSFPTIAFEPKVIQADDLVFWTESFGDKKNPALILIMGSGGQGILWPQQFCEQLASKGFFIIRYDHRDTGLSSSINYQSSPYTLLDMANDVISIMDAYSLDKAHIVGASMGGTIAMLLAAYYPERIANLILLMTTIDMRPAFDAFTGKPSNSTLSMPEETILAAVKNIVTPPNTLAEKVSSFIDSARINSGGKVPIDEPLCRQIGLQVFLRMQNPEGVNNHFQAAQASHDLVSKTSNKITAPTFIIHGDSDPVFPVDHAYATQQAIQHSRLAIIPDLGHGISSAVWLAPIIDKIVEGTHANT